MASMGTDLQAGAVLGIEGIRKAELLCHHHHHHYTMNGRPKQIYTRCATQTQTPGRGLFVPSMTPSCSMHMLQNKIKTHIMCLQVGGNMRLPDMLRAFRRRAMVDKAMHAAPAIIAAGRAAEAAATAGVQSPQQQALQYSLSQVRDDRCLQLLPFVVSVAYAWLSPAACSYRSIVIDFCDSGSI
jgi:hypothetical protein